jgi:hypothetical protein
MARTWWGQWDPIGQRIKFGDEKWREIVGVVGDVHHEALAAQVEPEMYVPYGQVPNVEARPTIVLRSSVDPAAKLVAIGICAGLAGALLLARLIASLLYGVTPFDALTLASVSILLATVALAASCARGAWRKR